MSEQELGAPLCVPPEGTRSHSPHWLGRSAAEWTCLEWCDFGDIAPFWRIYGVGTFSPDAMEKAGWKYVGRAMPPGTPGE